MTPGQLDRRITIQSKTVTQDTDYGTEAITWTTFAARISAQVQDVLPSKSESVQQGMRVATRPARVRIRYRTGITSDMRVIVHSAGELTNRTMQITGGPAEIGRHEWIEMTCEEYTV